MDISDQKRKLIEKNIKAEAKLKNFDVDATVSTIVTGGEMKIVYVTVGVNYYEGLKEDAINGIKTIVKKYVSLEDDKISILIGDVK